jgi:ABC-type phosphate/phosphonate transport system substrate-binding protein
LTDLISRRINYRIDFAVEEGTSPEDLLEFGRKLNDGTLHLGVVWGLEFGWLRKRFPDLEPFVVVDQGERFTYQSQLLVPRQDPLPGLSDLQGRTLVRSKRAPLVDKIFLHARLAKDRYDTEGFFDLKECGSSRAAIQLLKRGDAQCMTIDRVTFLNLKAVQPAFVEGLTLIEHSDDFPMPVIIGRRTRVDALAQDLWAKAQRESLAVHTTTEGEQFVLFWHMRKFVKPTPSYLDSVNLAAIKYDIEILTSVK